MNMADFEVQVMRIDSVEDHPNADRLSLNKIRGYVAVSNKQLLCSDILADKDVFVHRYRPGQLVVYVPEGAVVPDALLKQMGYWDTENDKGILAGSKGNRVKAVKLRGVISQGLIFPFAEVEVDDYTALEVPLVSEDGIVSTESFLIAQEGDNVADTLRIVKYEPEVPASMDGELIFNPDYVVKFDIENAQKYPAVFQPGENVFVTEKLHGTFTGVVFTQNTPEGFDRIQMNGMDISYSAFSKGCGAKGFTFEMSHDNVNKNVYCSVAVKLAYNQNLQRHLCRTFFHNEGGLEFIAILGETFGKGVQDLDYSMQNRDFAAFSVVFKWIDGSQEFLSQAELVEFLSLAGIPMVPFLFSGPYDEQAMIELRDSKSAIDGQTVREGIVIVPECEGSDDQIGRRVLKMVSPDYLTRKNGTEYN
jgi:RNA ligase (TIGR02306 family)